MTATDLPDRVRAALQHRAEALEVDVPPFDPAAPSTLDLEPAPPRRPRAVLAAAAVLVVALVAGAVALAGDGPDADGPERPTATEVAPVPPVDPEADAAAAALVPTGVPDGMEPTAVGVEESAGETVPPVQLFASADGAARVQLVVEEGSGSPTGTGPTVRGRPAEATGSRIRWTEGRWTFTAEHTGLTDDEVVAVLDGLVPRAGVQPPWFDGPSGGLDLVAEAPAGVVDRRTTALAYTGDGRRLEVSASALLAGSPDHDRVRAAFAGAEDDEGRLVAYDRRLDDLTVIWADGRRVVVSGDGSFGEVVLRAVALSVVPIDAAAYAALLARIGEGEPVPPDAGTAPGPGAGQHTVGPVSSLVHDAGGRGVDQRLGIRAEVEDPTRPGVCLVVEELPATCESAADRPGVASVLVDGHWYVGVATQDPAVRITRGQPGPGADPVPVPGVGGGEVDGWVLWVAALADDVDRVWVGTDEAAVEVRRPTG